MNEWNIFQSRCFYFIHLNINSLFPKIEEHRFIAKWTNGEIIGISESKLDEYVLEPEIQIDDYKILRCNRSRHRGSLFVACYLGHNLSLWPVYDLTWPAFPCEIERVFFEILLPNSKPIKVGTIYRHLINPIFWYY